MSQVLYCAQPHGSGDYAVGDAVEFVFHKRGTCFRLQEIDGHLVEHPTWLAQPPLRLFMVAENAIRHR
jgi:hypothetical protein